MINKNKIIISNNEGIVALSFIELIFLIITILLIVNAEMTFWSTFNFVFPITFLLFWITLAGYLLIQTIREKTIIDDESITARFFIESKKNLPIIRYRSKYETVLFSEIAKLKQGVMYTSSEHSFDSETLVIQTNSGRDLHFQRYFYSKRTIKIIIDALCQHIDCIRQIQ
ncbi:MAG: hypothetical protein KKE16_03700 [Firmicutes bacterium]|nr:hypothetical protein [Bacillota bacterium]